MCQTLGNEKGRASFQTLLRHPASGAPARQPPSSPPNNTRSDVTGVKVVLGVDRAGALRLPLRYVGRRMEGEASSREETSELSGSERMEYGFGFCLLFLF